MNKFLVVGLVVVVLLSCERGGERGDRPMPREAFTELLLQAYIMEGDKNSRAKNRTDGKPIDWTPRDTLLTLYGLNEEAFRQVYDWYIADMEEMDSIYADILMRLTVLKDHVVNSDSNRYHLPLDKKSLQFSRDSLSE